MGEQWRNVIGYEGIYQISNLGRVKSLNYCRTGKAKVLKPSCNSIGYLLVNLFKDKEHKSFYIHRLVAMAFVDNPNGYNEVNHIDEDKTNNKAENLEFCSRKYNCNYGSRNQNMSKIVICDGKEFESITNCAEFFNVERKTMSSWLTGRNPMPIKFKELKLKYKI